MPTPNLIRDLSALEAVPPSEFASLVASFLLEIVKENDSQLVNKASEASLSARTDESLYLEQVEACFHASSIPSMALEPYLLRIN